MSDYPHVPDEPIGNASKTRAFSVGSDYDAVEGGAANPNQQKVDAAKLKAIEFEHQAKKHAFYFTLIAAAALFVCGAFMFYHASHRMFGWQTILILFAFFAPATIVLTFLIRAVFTAISDKKDDSKKDDLTDMLPSAAVVKMIAELFKPK